VQADASHDAAPVVAYCRERDVACLGCGYNLRDTDTGVCPECGRRLLLCVDDPAARARPALWMSCAWCATVSVVTVAAEALQWHLAGGRPRPYTIGDALLAALMMLMFVYGVAGTAALALRSRLAGTHLWLRVGWGLWGALMLHIAWSALVVPIVLGMDC
jgi:hypothetical protein